MTNDNQDPYRYAVRDSRNPGADQGAYASHSTAQGRADELNRKYRTNTFYVQDKGSRR